MSEIQRPGPQTIRGRVLDSLEEAGDKGTTCRAMMRTLSVHSPVVVQAAIHDLRKGGYRIDHHDGRYHFLGKGVSFTTYRKGEDPVAVGTIQLRKQVKAPRGFVKAAVAKKVQVTAPANATSQALFTIDRGEFAKAMKILPSEQGAELQALTRRAEAYNAAIELYRKAEETLKVILNQR